MERSYKFRIYPNAVQQDKINRTFGCCRFVYNHFLKERIRRSQGSSNYEDWVPQSSDLTELKKNQPWLREVDSLALVRSLFELNSMVRHYYEKEKGWKDCFPKFKSRKHSRQSYHTSLVNGNIRLTDKAIVLPKLGAVECRISRKVEGRILDVIVSRNSSGKHFVAIRCTDVDVSPLPKTGKSIGIDLGFDDLAVTSEGVKYYNPKFLKSRQRRIKRLQQQLSRKSSDSRRGRKARARLDRQYEKARNQRADYLHKLSIRLVRKYDVIAIETIDYFNLSETPWKAKSIHDAGWRDFQRQLEYKAAWYGKCVVAISQCYPSSQRCYHCRYKNSALRDYRIRRWTCPKCGRYHDRDVNAARNILKEGMEEIRRQSGGNNP